MTLNNEQKAFLDGMKAALDMLKEAEKSYLIEKTDRIQQKIAKEHVLSAFRQFGEGLQEAINDYGKEPEEPEKKPARKRTAKTTA